MLQMFAFSHLTLFMAMEMTMAMLIDWVSWRVCVCPWMLSHHLILKGATGFATESRKYRKKIIPSEQTNMAKGPEIQSKSGNAK